MTNLTRPGRILFLVATLLANAVVVSGQHLKGGATTNQRRMVLKYDHSVDLEDVAEAVLEAGAKVERQLSCTRGLIVRVDDQGRRALAKRSGMTLVNENDAHPTGNSANGSIDTEDMRRRLQEETNDDGPLSPQGEDQSCNHQATCSNLNEVPILEQSHVDIIKHEIRTELLRDEGSFDGSIADSAGAILRLVFHDAANFNRNSVDLSGLNGCVNINNPSNNGLQNAVAYIAQLQLRLLTDHSIVISKADLTVLAAIVTVEVTIDQSKAVNANYQGRFRVNFKYGRPDIACSCQDDFVPKSLTTDGSLYSFRVLDEQMGDRIGFTRRETAALMGAHTIGASEFENSGFPASQDRVTPRGNITITKSPWIGPNPSSNGRFGGNDGFDNRYYLGMMLPPWDKKETEVDGVTVVEWTFRHLTFLNPDGALGFELDHRDEHGTPCNRFGGTPQFGADGCNDATTGLPVPGCVLCPELQNEYGDAVREYSQNNAAWLRDFSAAFQKMIDDLVPCGSDVLRFPVGSAGASGDPHFKQWNGDWYDFQGACDLHLLESPSLNMTVDIRTKIRYQYSYIESAAVRIGNDVLEVGSWGTYFWNGVEGAPLPGKMGVAASNDNEGWNLLNGKFAVSHKQINKKQHEFVIGLDQGEEIVVTTLKDMVSVKIENHDTGRFDDSVGMMGEFGTGTLLGRDGVTVFENDDPNAFALEWQVRPTVDGDEPMLFQTAQAPQYPQKCLLPDPNKAARRNRRRLGETGLSYEAARSACSTHHRVKASLEACIQDVLVTGDLDMAAPFL